MDTSNNLNPNSNATDNPSSLFMSMGQRLGILRKPNNSQFPPSQPSTNNSTTQNISNATLNVDTPTTSNASDNDSSFARPSNLNLTVNNQNPIMSNNRINNTLNVRQRNNNNLNVRFTPSSLSVAKTPSQSLSANKPRPRQKFRVEPGYSQLDWGNLKSSHADLRGIPKEDFPMRVSKLELKKHNKEDDCWICIHNKVYNITSYLKYHPGGVDYLMKCAGKDGTLLFNKYHSWINAERMLDECLVGIYVKG